MKNRKNKKDKPALKVHYPTDTFLRGMDKRRREYAELATPYNEIVEQLGGIENVSRIQISLIERFVFLVKALRSIERSFGKSKGKRKSALFRKWTYSVNALLGLARALGVNKKKAVNMPSLKAYAAGKKEA